MSIRQVLGIAAVGIALLASNGARAFPYSCGYEPTLANANQDVGTYMASLQFLSHRPEMNACYYYLMGTMLEFKGDHSHAIAAYDKAIGWWSGYADAYEAKGDAYVAMGQIDQATLAYHQAETLEPDNWQHLNSRCWTRAVRGTPLDRALTDCMLAAPQSGNNPDVVQSRCFVYYRMGFFDDAIKDCALSLQTRTRLSDGLYVKGLAELAKGDTAAGNDDIAKAKNADYRIAEKYALYGIKAP